MKNLSLNRILYELTYYDNTPVRLIAIFQAVKRMISDDKFILFFFSKKRKTKIVGTRYNRGASNEYPIISYLLEVINYVYSC